MGVEDPSQPTPLPLELADPALFPACVRQFTVKFDATDPRPLGAQFPGIALPPELSAAVRKRQLEFLAGRYCAREALRRCAPELASTPVGRGPNREPLWPPAIVGTIAHSKNYASVALARSCDLEAVGLDVERWIEPPVAEEIAEKIAGRDELDAVMRASGWSSARALTLVFSAKESLFKCLYPQAQRYFDFRDASVECANEPRGEFTATLLVTLTGSAVAGSAYAGRFEHDDELVRTGIAIPAR
jgi:enterobactin synthetase component D